MKRLNGKLQPMGAPLTVHRAVLDFIARQGDHGATLNEIAAGLAARPQSISARLTELRRRGAIASNGRTRPAPKRSKARVWVIKPTKG